MAKYAAAADRNQPEIIDALRKAGATVTTLHRVAGGCPDLLVGFRGTNILLEVKDGAKPPSERKLTPSQKEWHATWAGQKAVVCSAEEALSILFNAPAEIPLEGWVM